jgi:drug/metabolite transporter (DMT)-like permease
MNRNFIFLLIAMIGVAFLVTTGFSLGARSTVGGILSMIGAILTVGVGFMLKKKFREKDER